MASPSPGVSNLTALLQSASTAGGATFVRCPAESLSRLRSLNEAEIITLFTPFVPHPPSTDLAKNMDPFEPLGRSLPRQVRHVPYRLDHGMTQTHTDFLPASGAIIIVICSTENVTMHNPQAFEQQVRFARDVVKKAEENKALPSVPVVLLLVSNGPSKSSHEAAVRDFPALVTANDYTPAALANAVRVMFGK
ncbi:hypothetical protein BU26DRAFT_437131 [Trematosphaeria pertusa]|uniref:Uncharacterized protein n=1 Tax=Trematosphaeria pertusa TaxID=390896 RepID=A0A6A6HZV6_9PLEO|nr:uncharacterized protein BU26DRAFT_437131 [Trematosphaeria pertusa]KAF2243439.1 hypothetical protein BU26DRAFT_437131 [Trematosphaeria pertusa]